MVKRSTVGSCDLHEVEVNVINTELGIPNEIRYFGISVLPAVLSGTEIPNAISVPIPIPNG